jgi:hypothetical protein
MSEHDVSLGIAGLTLRLLDDVLVPPEWLTTTCAPFQVSAAPAANALTVAIHRDPSFERGEDQLHLHPGQEPGGFHMRGYDFLIARRRCGLPFEVEAHPDAGMAGVLRWVTSLALLEQGGLLLHAASGALEGRGIICAGPSGSGKTTLSRLLQSHLQLFTDETTAVQFTGAMPLAYATPFAGELGPVSGPAAAPLEVVCFLKHAKAHAVRALHPAEAVERLMGCTFLPRDGTLWITTALATAERLARAVPCLELAFAPEASVVEVVRDVLAQPVSPA